ncbi:hypothetical protein SAMN02910369_01109 [Lachnospiraceae bacterium NE2001]|nr:hypothetical protein SAMN02910369_01109 [Lachnospiraceae bacterium NE2001]
MFKKFLSAALATTLIVAGACLPGGVNAAGSWENTDRGWMYKVSDGVYASNEYIDGWWIGEDGIQSYSAQASWKKDSTGWWYGDTTGWYAKNTSYKIDGVWYWFNSKGYIYEKGWINGTGGWWYQYEDGSYAANEWVDGYWLSADGYWTYKPQAQWYKDSEGWYYMDSSGYYEKGGAVKIDGKVYWFDDRGYLKEYTILVPSSTAQATVSVTISADQKATAVNEMNALFSATIEKGIFKELTINGTKRTISNKDGVIYVDDKTLNAYVTDAVSKDANVSFNFNLKTTELLAGISLTDVSKYINYVKIGDVTFTNVKSENGISFDVNGTSYKGSNQDGALYVSGNVSEADWVKSLVNAGAIEKNTPITY